MTLPLVGAGPTSPVAASPPFAVQLVGVGTAAKNNSGSSFSVPLPAGIQADDLLVCAYVGGGNTTTVAGFTATASTILGSGRQRLNWKVAGVSESAPTLNPFGNTNPMFAQIAAFRGLGAGTTADGFSGVTGTSQNIGPPNPNTTTDSGLAVLFGAKVSTWTSVATASGDGLTWEELHETSTGLGGADRWVVWDWATVPTGAHTIDDTTLTVSGGASDTWGVVLSCWKKAP